jgi:hypothetical protein
MASPYELKTRWLTWHERWPVPEIESLKRQIETIKRLLADHGRVLAYIEQHAPEDSKPKLLAMMNRNPSIAELNEVLATLERLLPPF